MICPKCKSEVQQLFTGTYGRLCSTCKLEIQLQHAKAAPKDWELGHTVEHILLSVTVVHTNQIIQYDDSCAYLIQKHLKDYTGVVRVEAQVQYNHTKTDVHIKGCQCGICNPTGCDEADKPYQPSNAAHGIKTEI